MPASKPRPRVGCFIFRRDLRLHDNTGLLAALRECKRVGLAFVLTPEQLDPAKNPFFSNNAVQFMIESLDDLEGATKGKLQFYFASPADGLKAILKANSDITDIYVNRDYTPYSVRRDREMEDICLEAGVHWHSLEDLLLLGADEVRTLGDKYYTKFSPYLKRAMTFKVREPKSFTGAMAKRLFKLKGGGTGRAGDRKRFYEENPNILVRGGRENGLKLLREVKAGARLAEYNKKRNCLTYETTHLSAYNKFGCLSIREEYYHFVKAFGKTKNNGLMVQLHWRDFYTQILAHDPGALRGPQRETMKFLDDRWTNNKSEFKAWCEGRTGFPIVDACMRQLNETGWMHNRGRLIVSNFLIKLLGIDWRWGEKYFAQRLVDYDVAVNNGNWQWSAGTGSDVQGYIRIFNPWTQMDKFDPEGEYIKRWVPELRGVDAVTLRGWEKPKVREEAGVKGYPEPIVDYKKARERGLKMYKRG